MKLGLGSAKIGCNSLRHWENAFMYSVILVIRLVRAVYYVCMHVDCRNLSYSYV